VSVIASSTRARPNAITPHSAKKFRAAFQRFARLHHGSYIVGLVSRAAILALVVAAVAWAWAPVPAGSAPSLLFCPDTTYPRALRAVGGGHLVTCEPRQAAPAPAAGYADPLLGGPPSWTPIPVVSRTPVARARGATRATLCIVTSRPGSGWQVEECAR